MKKQVKKTVKTASNKQTADAAVAASTSLVPFQAMLLNLDLEKIVPSKLNPRGEIAEAAGRADRQYSPLWCSDTYQSASHRQRPIRNRIWGTSVPGVAGCRQALYSGLHTVHDRRGS